MANFCVIGAGQWGRNHLRVMRELLGNGISVCEINKNLASGIQNSYPNMKISSDFNEVLADRDISAVSICTPASSHYEMAKRALDAGKDVLVEKPLTLNTGEAEELTELAEKNGRILMVGHIFRYHSAVQALKKEIDSGLFGNINMMMASRMGLMTPRPDCGVIFDFAIHEFDTMSYLLGKMPYEVTATGLHTPDKHAYEDAAFITLKFPGGTVGHVQVSWLTPIKIREIMAVGTKKTARLNYLSHDIEIYDCGIVPQYDTFGKFNLIAREGGMLTQRASIEEPLKAELSHFMECVATRKKPMTDGRCGTNAVFIAEKAVESLKSQRSMPLKWS